MTRRKVWQVNGLSRKRQRFQQRRKETSQNRHILLERRTRLLKAQEKAKEQGNHNKVNSISKQITEIDKKLNRIE